MDIDLHIKKLIRLLKFLKDPLRFRNAILYKIASILFRKNNGFYIFDEYWDNLIILDACRYDFFRDLFIKQKMKGRLYKKISRGSHTETFLLENFVKEKYDDIIYITANPYVNQTLKNKFFKLISVWNDGWSDKYHTVLPETLYEYTLDALIKYPDKKLIIHFMQPHPPFINFNVDDNSFDVMRNLSLHNNKFVNHQKIKHSLLTWFGAGIYTKLDKKTRIKAYKDNLDLTIPYIEKLIDRLPGFTVVTADHGEALGEKFHRMIPIKFYGHMRRIRIQSVIDVPWLLVKPEEKEYINNDILKRKTLLASIERLKKKRAFKKNLMSNMKSN